MGALRKRILNKVFGAINDAGEVVYWSNEAYSDTYFSIRYKLNNFTSYNF